MSQLFSDLELSSVANKIRSNWQVADDFAWQLIMKLT